MSTILKLTEKEYNLIKDLNKAIHNVIMEGGKNSNIDYFFHEKDVTEDNLSNLEYDIKNDELIEAIDRLYNGKTRAVAYDSDGVGFTVVEILHNFYDNVFGFTEFNNERTFYLCETKDSYNHELKEDETTFFVDDNPVYLNNCIRLGI